jgi:hypothetical protein
MKCVCNGVQGYGSSDELKAHQQFCMTFLRSELGDRAIQVERMSAENAKLREALASEHSESLQNHHAWTSVQILYDEARAEVERLREVLAPHNRGECGGKDYADMRHFQAKFMESDHKVRSLELQVGELCASFKKLVTKIEKTGFNGMYCIEVSGSEWDEIAAPFFSLRSATTKTGCAPKCCEKPNAIGLVCICDCHKDEWDAETPKCGGCGWVAGHDRRCAVAGDDIEKPKGECSDCGAPNDGIAAHHPNCITLKRTQEPPKECLPETDGHRFNQWGVCMRCGWKS